MEERTERIIADVLDGDRTIKARERNAALAILRGEKLDAVAAGDDKIMTRKEAAAKLRISKVSVTNWGKRGIIRRVSIPNRRKAVGYSYNSVMDIVNGRVKVETAQG